MKKRDKEARLLRCLHLCAFQVRSLDSDMQMLVYENYNKFITATDMIRKMKHNVESMDEQMKKLSENMENISGSCEYIEGQFSSNRVLSRLFYISLTPKTHASAHARIRVSTAVVTTTTTTLRYFRHHLLAFALSLCVSCSVCRFPSF